MAELRIKHILINRLPDRGDPAVATLSLSLVRRASAKDVARRQRKRKSRRETKAELQIDWAI